MARVGSEGVGEDGGRGWGADGRGGEGLRTEAGELQECQGGAGLRAGW